MTTLPFSIVGFDLDGTLFDTSGDLGAAVNHALKLAGRPEVPGEAVYGLIGGGSRLMLRRALALTGGEEDADFDGLYAELLAFYEANIAVHTRHYPGGEAMLDALDAAGVRIAIVTNKPQHLTDRLLDELGLTGRFACVIGAGTFPLKPAPDALHAMVERLGGGRAASVGASQHTRGAAAGRASFQRWASV